MLSLKNGVVFYLANSRIKHIQERIMLLKVNESIAEFDSFHQSTHREEVVRSVAAAILLLSDHHQHKELCDGKALIVGAIVEHREKMAELLGFVPVPNEEDIAKFRQQLAWLYNIQRNELDLVVVYDAKEGCDKKLSISVADTLMCLIPALFDQSRFVRSTLLDRLVQFYLLTIKLSGSKICSGGIRNQYIEMLHLDYKRTENAHETVFIFTAWEASLAVLSKVFYDKKFEDLKDKQFQYRVLSQWLNPSDNDSDFDRFLGDGSDLCEYLLSFLKHSGINLAKDDKIQKRVEGYVSKRNELSCPSPESLSRNIDCVASCLLGDYKQSLGIFALAIETDFNQCQTLEDIERFQLASRLRLGVIQNKACTYANLLPIGAEEANLRDVAREILTKIRENPTSINLGQIEDYDKCLSEAIKRSKEGDDNFLYNVFAVIMATDNPSLKFDILQKSFHNYRAKRLAILDDAQLRRWHVDQHVEIEHQFSVKNMTEDGITIVDMQINTVTMTPGSINRLILQAFDISPDQWTPTFSHLIGTIVLPLIKCSNNDDHTHYEVLKGSYLPCIINQLEWLLNVSNYVKRHNIKLFEYFCQTHQAFLFNLLCGTKLKFEYFFGVIDSNISQDQIDFNKPFANLVQHLSINKQITWLESIFSKMCMMVLPWLPQEKRLSFAREFESQVLDGFNLASMIRDLNDIDRLAYAKDMQEKIQNGSQLAKVLRHLNSIDRLEFARENKDKIQNDLELNKVLSTLEKADRWPFTAWYDGGIRESAHEFDQRNKSRIQEFKLAVENLDLAKMRMIHAQIIDANRMREDLGEAKRHSHRVRMRDLFKLDIKIDEISKECVGLFEFVVRKERYDVAEWLLSIKDCNVYYLFEIESISRKQKTKLTKAFVNRFFKFDSLRHLYYLSFSSSPLFFYDVVRAIYKEKDMDITKDDSDGDRKRTFDPNVFIREVAEDLIKTSMCDNDEIVERVIFLIKLLPELAGFVDVVCKKQLKDLEKLSKVRVKYTKNILKHVHKNYRPYVKEYRQIEELNYWAIQLSKQKKSDGEYYLKVCRKLVFHASFLITSSSVGAKANKLLNNYLPEYIERANEDKNIKPKTYLSLRLLFVDFLMDRGEYNKAINACNEILHFRDIYKVLDYEAYQREAKILLKLIEEKQALQWDDNDKSIEHVSEAQQIGAWKLITTEGRKKALIKLKHNLFFSEYPYNLVSKKQKTEYMIDKIKKQWTAYGKSPITKQDLGSIPDFKGSGSKKSLKAVKLKVENLSPDVKKALQNLIVYSNKLKRDFYSVPYNDRIHIVGKLKVLEDKLTSLQCFIDEVLSHHDLTEKDIQSTYERLQQEDVNRSFFGFYRCYTWRLNKTFIDKHGKTRAVKSTVGELAYDLMEAIKTKCETEYSELENEQSFSS